MSVLTALHHITHYRYDTPVKLEMQTIRLRPAPHTRSLIQSYSLKLSPKKHFVNWQQDPFGNFLARVVFPEKIREFKLEVDLLTEIRAFNPFDFFLEDSAKSFPLKYDSNLLLELAPYLEIKEYGPNLNAWVSEINQPNESIIDYLVSVNQKLYQTLDYVVRLEPGLQSCEETLLKKKGSCRDMAWFLCQALRHVGLATRFASGYLIQLAQDVKSLDGPSGVETDFTDLHAWTEVFLPGAGWVGLDPTSGLFAGEGHIPLCCTPSPSSAAPVSGNLGECKSTLHHEMHISRVHEAPRPTKPYSQKQWEAIDQLGLRVDADLKAQNVQLTMGGEPTFVSLDDKEDKAWHYAALSENKKDLGKKLASRLREKLTPKGVMMITQGKWYPGEILPRWAIPCFSRTDGEPLWTNSQYLADPEYSLEHTANTAHEFITELAQKLEIPAHYILPAREDTPYYLWKEQKLPLQEEIMEADVFEKKERQRLQTLMNKNLNQPVGYVLPLHYSHQHGRWVSNAWKFKSKHLILLTGDSPLGLRLPIKSLPSPAKAYQETCPERSLFAKIDPLPSYQSLNEKMLAPKEANDSTFHQAPNGTITTALSAEARNGVLHLFLPPLTWAEHFVELLVAIEQVAKKLKIPVVLEGYTPPQDPRLKTFSVTPDPGVLEINVPPATDWEELKTITNTVYEDARLTRLSAEKFNLDGRRVGTGGGNHIVLGATNPEESPFLRRPDLLRSMIAFWQNHPSLSFLFSGMYVGPTSQAPRIDEARHDSLYELEIAFSQIPENGKMPPWLVDRLFRNLLIDSTGNTHRAEFCIDKLYSPDSERGRLGLLEMRGFEMPPHPQMSLLQSLLLRVCVASFWKTPYTKGLIRWGTTLHDRFMLPHYLWEDFCDVLNTLIYRGYPLKTEWFQPFEAFRFPKCGSIQIGNVLLTLKTALEPWPVMGEALACGGMSRAVDATVERLEVKTQGLIPERQILTCNGRRIPLSPTQEGNTHVGGVRFKAWTAFSSLHPELPTHAPLVFDIIDTEHERSIGGCTYHCAHPGGRNYETYPINENEAEGRKLARFESMGHTPGPIEIPPHEINYEFPYTLDLRFRPFTKS